MNLNYDELPPPPPPPPLEQKEDLVSKSSDEDSEESATVEKTSSIQPQIFAPQLPLPLPHAPVPAPQKSAIFFAPPTPHFVSIAKAAVERGFKGRGKVNDVGGDTSSDEELTRKQRDEEMQARMGGGGGGDSEDGEKEEPKIDKDIHDKGTCAPSLARFIKIFGPPSPAEECYLCEKERLDCAAVPYQAFHDLADMLKKNLGSSTHASLCRSMRQKWREEVMTPANKAAAKLRKPLIPDIKEIDFYMHYTRHNKDSTLYAYNQIDRLVELENEIYDKCLYKKVKRPNGRTKRVPRKKWVKLYFTVLKEHRMARNQKPSTQFLFTPSFELDYSQRSWMNTDRPFSAVNLPSVYLGKGTKNV